MKSKKDAEWKDWEYPMHEKGNSFITNRCVGKNVTDAVEALACALYLSTRCIRTVMDWISDIKLVPITMAAEMIDKFKYGVDTTLRLYRPLEDYKLKVEDTVRDIFEKYFIAEGGASLEPSLQHFVFYRIDSPAPGDLGD